MDIAPTPAPMTREAFLDWAERQELPYEFDGVEPVPMNGGSFWHFKITSNIMRELFTRLDERTYQVLPPGAGISTVGDKVRFPDVLVIPAGTSSPVRLMPNPIVVFEVKSPSSDRLDRFTKAREYAAVPSILRYVLLEQDSMHGSVMSRRAGGQSWTLDPLTQGETLRLPEIGAEVPLDAFYAGVEFPA